MAKKTITINVFDPASIKRAIAELEAYKKTLEDAGMEIARRLGQIGYDVAFSVMSGHVFSGETSESLAVTERDDGVVVLSAQSQALLFFEFGAGVKYGAGHPWDDDTGYGPGTYPGNGHWDDPEGWWFPTDDPRLIIRTSKDENGNEQGWGHSYGNRPYMPFYKADKAMKEALIKTAEEVLSGK